MRLWCIPTWEQVHRSNTLVFKGMGLLASSGAWGRLQPASCACRMRRSAHGC